MAYNLFDETCGCLTISGPSPPNLLTDFSERKLAPRLRVVVRDSSREYLMLPSREYLLLQLQEESFRTLENQISMYDTVLKVETHFSKMD